MMRVRVATSCVLLLTSIVGGWPAGASATTVASWLPRGSTRPPSTAQAGSADRAGRTVVKVSGGSVGAVAAAVEAVGGTVRTVSPGSVLAWVAPDQVAPLSHDGRVTGVSSPHRP